MKNCYVGLLPFEDFYAEPNGDEISTENTKLSKCKSRGDYSKLGEDFVKDGKDILHSLSEIVKKYGMNDEDTILNLIKDNEVAKYLGFNFVNKKKHGWDALNDKGEYLEIKECGTSAKQMNAAFNDTSEEKADELSDDNIALAVGVWENCELKFIIHGRCKDLGKDLKTLIIKAKNSGKNNRPGHHLIPITKLITKYNFSIMPINWGKEKIYEFLLKNKSRQTISKYDSTIVFD